MAMTAQEVFDSAISLMDERNPADGSTETSDTAEYKFRSIDIINLLAMELYQYSDTFKVKKEGKRPVPNKISEWTDVMPLDDAVCGVLVYGLASQLLMQEDMEQSARLANRYESGKALLLRGFPTESDDIDDIYGGLENYNQFGAWT